MQTVKTMPWHLMIWAYNVKLGVNIFKQTHTDALKLIKACISIKLMIVCLWHNMSYN